MPNSFKKNLNKINGLTIDELVKIYSGKITNWNQINHTKRMDKVDSITIHPYSKQDNCSGTAEIFKSKIMKGIPFKGVDETKSETQDIIKEMNNENTEGGKGGIYYLTLTEVQASNAIVPIASDGKAEFVSPGTRNAFGNPIITKTDTYDSKLVRDIFIVFKNNVIGERIAEMIKSKEVQDELEKLGYKKLN